MVFNSDYFVLSIFKWIQHNYIGTILQYIILRQDVLNKSSFGKYKIIMTAIVIYIKKWSNEKYNIDILCWVFIVLYRMINCYTQKKFTELVNRISIHTNLCPCAHIQSMDRFASVAGVLRIWMFHNSMHHWDKV